MEKKELSGPDEDMTVVLSVRGGRVDDFERLVTKYQKMMFNIAYRMTGSYEDAAEVVQDAFLSAFRHLDTFKGLSKFSTWLCSIVLNFSKNRMQQMNTIHRQEQYSLDDPVETEDGSVAREVASGAPSAVENLEREEIRKRVRDCIKGLESDFREVVVLKDIQGFAYDEIRNMLKIPEGTVKSRLSRAREALKDCLKRALGEL
jgi:RNA polymerase sigma-70 factor (ECF subfamily)